MCGIAGFLSLDGSAIEARILLAMTERLRHRGPDDGGVVFFGEGGSKAFLGESALEVAESRDAIVGLGHRRLAIIDIASGAQPISDSTGDHWIVFNGEIYNHRRLRVALEEEGATFRTASDSEVVVTALARWGVAALDRFEGMFAIAWWDRRERRMLLVRDRLGIKPLYYARIGSTLAFASEIKALLLLPGLRRDLDLESLRDFLIYRYVPSPRTIYGEFRSLPQGHFLRLDPGSAGRAIEPECWWKLDASRERDIALDEAVDELDTLLDDVCRDHLVSDVPVGLFLTSGVDSSTILAHSAKYAAGDLRAVTVGFRGRDDSKYNELRAAEATAKHFGVPFTPIDLDADVIRLLPNAISVLDEPMADPSVLPALAMMREARDVAKVMLSGDGGDEVFGGYQRYHKPVTHPRTPGARNAIYALVRGVGEWVGVRMQRAETRMFVMSPDDGKQLVRPEFAARGEFSTLRRRFDVARSRDPLTQWQQLDLQTYLVDDNLKKTDRTSMAHGIEVRVPLVDHRVVEFGFSLAATLRRDRDWGKVVLREALGRYLPRDTTHRSKIGFKVPLSKWFRNEEQSPYLDALFDPSRPIWRILRPEVALAWLTEHRAASANHAQRLYSLLVLDEWLRANAIL